MEFLVECQWFVVSNQLPNKYNQAKNMIIKTNSCISIYHYVSICTWMPWGCSYFTFIHICLSMIPYMILLIRPNYSGKCGVLLHNIINRCEYFDGGWCYCTKYHCIWEFLFFLFFALPSVNYVPSFFVYRESNAVIFLIVFNKMPWGMNIDWISEN